MENLQKCQKLAPDWFIPVGPGFTRRRVPEAEIGAILPPAYLQVLVQRVDLSPIHTKN